MLKDIGVTKIEPSSLYIVQPSMFALGKNLQESLLGNGHNKVQLPMLP